MGEQIKPVPLTNRGKLMAWLMVAGLLVIWAFAAHVYVALPQFAIEFLGVSLALSIAPALILLITKYRFALVNKYPYLINLPAFYMYLSRVPVERRSIFVNRYFEAILALGVAVTLVLIVIEYGIYIGVVYGEEPIWMVATIPLLIAPVIILLLYLRKVWREVRLEAGA